MELIDKDAVVAKIKHHIKEETHSYFCKCLLSEIDTLEVKEVDLEDYYHKFLEKEWFGKHCNRTISEMMAFTAKHFFELGMQQSKNDSKNERTERL